MLTCTTAFGSPHACATDAFRLSSLPRCGVATVPIAPPVAMWRDTFLQGDHHRSVARHGAHSWRPNLAAIACQTTCEMRRGEVR